MCRELARLRCPLRKASAEGGAILILLVPNGSSKRKLALEVRSWPWNFYAKSDFADFLHRRFPQKCRPNWKPWTVCPHLRPMHEFVGAAKLRTAALRWRQRARRAPPTSASSRERQPLSKWACIHGATGPTLQHAPVLSPRAELPSGPFPDSITTWYWVPVWNERAPDWNRLLRPPRGGGPGPGSGPGPREAAPIVRS